MKERREGRHIIVIQWDPKNRFCGELRHKHELLIHVILVTDYKDDMLPFLLLRTEYSLPSRLWICQARLLKTPGLTYCCGNTCCPPDTADAGPPANSTDSRRAPLEVHVRHTHRMVFAPLSFHTPQKTPMQMAETEARTTNVKIKRESPARFQFRL